jgi:hypothetical protein
VVASSDVTFKSNFMKIRPEILDLKHTDYNINWHIYVHIVQCLWYWTTSDHQTYIVWPLMEAKMELARLQKTPFCLLHLFIYDSTSRRYNLSFTMNFGPLMSCLGAVLGSLLLLNAGS